MTRPAGPAPLTPADHAFRALDTLAWRLAVRTQCGAEIATSPSHPSPWARTLDGVMDGMDGAWPAPDPRTPRPSAQWIAETVHVLDTITPHPAPAARAAHLDAWVAAAEADVIQALDVLARTDVEGFAHWWTHLRLDRLLQSPELLAHLVTQMVHLVVTGAWLVPALARITRDWAPSVGVAILQPLWATIARLAATASDAETRARAADRLAVAWAYADGGEARRAAARTTARWRWHLVSGLARAADSAAGVAVLDRYVPLPPDATPLTPDHAARLLATPPGLRRGPVETLVDIARRIPLPALLSPTRFPSRPIVPSHAAEHARAFAPLFVLLGEAAIMASAVRETLWQRATTADARVALLVALPLTARGPWWGDPTFTREAFEALQATTVPDAVFSEAPHGLPVLLAEHWGRVPLDLWLAVSLRAMPEIPAWLTHIAPRVAWGMPHAGARREDLLPLLQHADARVREVGQSLLALVPLPSASRRR